MNLAPLFERQRQLDKFIIKTKGLEEQDLLQNKILALQVELGELANEWRGFKHWSDNQEPKHGYAAFIDCDKCGGKGFWFNGPRVQCTKCNQTGKIINPLLEEYVDCLHFILSIGLTIGKDLHNAIEAQFKNKHCISRNVIEQFLDVIRYVDLIRDDDYYDELFATFYHLGKKLGFTWEQIEQAYYAKWQENIRRQQTGY